MSKRPLTGLGSDTEQLARQALRAADAMAAFWHDETRLCTPGTVEHRRAQSQWRQATARYEAAYTEWQNSFTPPRAA